MELKLIRKVIVLNGRNLKRDSKIESDDDSNNLKFMYYERVFY